MLLRKKGMMAAGPAAGRSATQNQNELVGKYNKST
jgi:hypothetical protein